MWNEAKPRLSTEFYILVSAACSISFSLFFGPYISKYLIPYYAHYTPFIAYLLYSETKLRDYISNNPLVWIFFVFILGLLPLIYLRWLI